MELHIRSSSDFGAPYPEQKLKYMELHIRSADLGAPYSEQYWIKWVTKMTSKSIIWRQFWATWIRTHPVWSARGREGFSIVKVLRSNQLSIFSPFHDFSRHWSPSPQDIFQKSSIFIKHGVKLILRKYFREQRCRAFEPLQEYDMMARSEDGEGQKFLRNVLMMKMDDEMMILKMMESRHKKTLVRRNLQANMRNLDLPCPGGVDTRLFEKGWK